MREPDTAAAAGRTHGEQTDSGSYASHGFFPRLGLLPGAGTLELGGRIVREYHSSVPNEIDHPGSGDRAESRTSLAPAQPADRADDALIHVVGAVDDDRPREGLVVESLVESVQPKRKSVLSLVRLTRDERPEAGLIAPGPIRKGPSDVVAGISTVGHQLMLEHLSALDIEHPESPLAREEAVIDDSEKLARRTTLGRRARVGREREIEDLAPQPCGSGDGLQSGCRRGIA